MLTQKEVEESLDSSIALLPQHLDKVKSLIESKRWYSAIIELNDLIEALQSITTHEYILEG